MSKTIIKAYKSLIKKLTDLKSEKSDLHIDLEISIKQKNVYKRCYHKLKNSEYSSGIDLNDKIVLITQAINTTKQQILLHNIAIKQNKKNIKKIKNELSNLLK